MILLTGSSGFLGKIILSNFERDQVKTLGRENADYTAHLNLEVPVLNEPFKLIIHSAGKAHTEPKTEAERQEFFDVNVTGTLNLLKSLEDSYLPEAFVFVSSVAVYGRESGLLIREDAPLLSMDAYGKSKIEAERIIQNWCKERNVICTILRLPLLAGPNPPGNLKAMINGINAGFYFNIDRGKAKKSVVMAKDVAEIIPVVSKRGGIYNLTDQYHPDFLELSQIIAKQLSKRQPLNIPKSIALILAKLGDLLGGKFPIDSKKLEKITSDLTFDDSKAVADFNWHPKSVLDNFRIR